MTGVDRYVLPHSVVKGNRSYFENINLIGLKRKGFSNNEIENYKNTIENLFKSKNLKKYIESLKDESSLVDDLINFLKNKNPNRDICRPFK